MERHIAFDRLRNFRDLGGYRGAGGRLVRWRRLYRSDAPVRLAGRDLERFRELGVRTVIDLRYPWEIEKHGRVPEQDGLTYVNLSVEHRPYDQAEISPDVDPWRYLADRYAEVAVDGVAELRRTLEVVATAPGPLLFHCKSGKDRTGMVAALVLSLLDVAEDDIVADFALTELATDHLLAVWRAAHPGREPRWPGYGRAPGDIMRLFLDDLAETYGSVHAYVTDRLGLDKELISRMRGELLEP
ncbi:tyrosine-protein phosphatase [Nonomuraea sp. NPDC048826]|uniref:tyrosine-protein phosphatase n=1 Tax=Nonomuraea sp. NPDC048826 TaxID=3364347 RepID=UPI0037192285